MLVTQVIRTRFLFPQVLVVLSKLTILFVLYSVYHGVDTSTEKLLVPDSITSPVTGPSVLALTYGYCVTVLKFAVANFEVILNKGNVSLMVSSITEETFI